LLLLQRGRKLATDGLLPVREEQGGRQDREGYRTMSLAHQGVHSSQRLRAGNLFLLGSLTTCLFCIIYVAYYHTFGLGRPQPTIACDVIEAPLGVVSSTAVIPWEFVIYNRGQRPLILTRVRPGCGECVQVIDFTQAPIPPGQTGFVRVELFGKSITAPQVKGVTVESNDPRHPRFTLRLSARPVE
jgi:Protein of unknown function (DUF1573)